MLEIFISWMTQIYREIDIFLCRYYSAIILFRTSSNIKHHLFASPDLSILSLYTPFYWSSWKNFIAKCTGHLWVTLQSCANFCYEINLLHMKKILNWQEKNKSLKFERIIVHEMDKKQKFSSSPQK